MKNKLILVLCILLISAIVLSSCASPSGDLMKGIISKNKDRVAETMDIELNQAILNFTWNLFKESSNNQGNIMISAPSAYFALAMTLNGAANETKNEMLKALSADNISLEDLNTGLNDWMILISKNRTAK
ncbi:MAG TPA: serpin family protein, partial [Sedimentibacter sp.]|nr:serpin family protein [Sedimentibacter sp.]